MVEFTINTQASIGLVGKVEIWIEHNEPISFQVQVISEQVKESSFPLPQSLMILLLAVILGVTIYQKESVWELIIKYRTRFLNNSNFSKKTTDWQLISTKWATILPENELKVLEILFTKGKLNQKSLATELDVSEMTMSRIISRLETKQLVVREPLGMSNIIKLNKDLL